MIRNIRQLSGLSAARFITLLREKLSMMRSSRSHDQLLSPVWQWGMVRLTHVIREDS